jgi:hypothetical protein
VPEAAVTDTEAGGELLLGLFTVTGNVLVALWPPIVTLAASVRLPFGVAVLFHVYQRVVPVIVCDVRSVPSTDRVTVFVCPHVAVVEIPTV